VKNFTLTEINCYTEVVYHKGVEILL